MKTALMDLKTSPQRLSNLLQEIKPLAVEAGTQIMHRRELHGQAELKTDGSPVTEADLAAHLTILEGLKRLEFSAPVISEESWGATGGDDNPASFPRTFWLVDPLDGTREFIAGRDEFTVNIALVEDGTPVLGVIYAPALKTLYYAARGLGARKDEASGTTRLLEGRESNGIPFTAVVSRSHIDPETRAFLERNAIACTVPCGSSLKICLIAEGLADLYPRFGLTSLWDTAAGYIVALESGCRMISLKGGKLNYDLKEGILMHGFIVCAPSARYLVL